MRKSKFTEEQIVGMLRETDRDPVATVSRRGFPTTGRLSASQNARHRASSNRKARRFTKASSTVLIPCIKQKFCHVLVFGRRRAPQQRFRRRRRSDLDALRLLDDVRHGRPPSIPSTLGGLSIIRRTYVQQRSDTRPWKGKSGGPHLRVRPQCGGLRAGSAVRRRLRRAAARPKR